jgi:hypothetical protein
MFFIFWRGWGIAALGAWLLSAAIFAIGATVLLGSKQADAIDTWVAAPVCFLTAAFVFLLARRLNQQEPRVLIDKLTGREVIFRRHDSLFFIPLAYWTHIYLGLGAILLVAKLLGRY